MTNNFDKVFFTFLLPLIIGYCIIDYIQSNTVAEKERVAHEEQLLKEEKIEREKIESILFQLEEKERRAQEEYFKEQKADFLIQKAIYEKHKIVVNKNADIKQEICKLEGFSLTKYDDVGNVETIGCGITGIKKDVITKQEHDFLIDDLVERHIKEIKRIGIKFEDFNRNQQTAMILSIHQLGLTLFKRQPFMKCLNNTTVCNKEQIKYLWGERGFANYSMFQKIGGVKVKVGSLEAKGLRNRRRLEANLFLK